MSFWDIFGHKVTHGPTKDGTHKCQHRLCGEDVRCWECPILKDCSMCGMVGVSDKQIIELGDGIYRHYPHCNECLKICPFNLGILRSIWFDYPGENEIEKVLDKDILKILKDSNFCKTIQIPIRRTQMKAYLDSVLIPYNEKRRRESERISKKISKEQEDSRKRACEKLSKFDNGGSYEKYDYH